MGPGPFQELKGLTGHLEDLRQKGYQKDHKEAKRQAEELARRCKILEARGEPINTRTVVWQWQDTTPAEKG